MKNSICYFVFFTLIPIVLFLNCSKQNSPTTPEVANGEPQIYQVVSGTNIQVNDQITGGTFIFQNTSGGTLSLTPITTNTSAIPEDIKDSKLFKITFTGNDHPLLKLPNHLDFKNELFMKTKILTSISGGASGNENYYIPLSKVDTSDTNFTYFYITDPFYIPSLNRVSPLSTKKVTDYEILLDTIRDDNWRLKNFTIQKELSLKVIRDIIGMMNDPIKSNIKYLSLTHPTHPDYSWTWIQTAAYFKAFFWVGPLRLIAPTIVFNSGTGLIISGDLSRFPTVVHESGHYLSYLILGDDYYEILENQALSLHDPLTLQPARNMIEEYAYLAETIINEYFVTNTLKADEFMTVIKNFGFKMTPEQVDYPSLEGFGCAFLARLNSAKTTIDIKAGVTEEIPPIGLSWGDIYDILSKKVVTVDELRAKSFIALGNKSDRLPVMMERLGWRYKGYGRIVDKSGSPLSNVKLTPMFKVESEGGKIYSNLSTTTGSDGKFSMSRLFPTKSILKAEYNGKSKEFIIDAPANNKTTDSLNLGTLIFDEPSLLENVTSLQFEFACESKTKYNGVPGDNRFIQINDLNSSYLPTSTYSYSNNIFNYKESFNKAGAYGDYNAYNFSVTGKLMPGEDTISTLTATYIDTLYSHDNNGNPLPPLVTYATCSVKNIPLIGKTGRQILYEDQYLTFQKNQVTASAYYPGNPSAVCDEIVWGATPPKLKITFNKP